MCTIDRLSIQGIRSYDPNVPVRIKFFKPLTIIVGQNGSGKTTIIESLKFACTGEPPPLSEKGKTFVHDPKRAGVMIVKGQIKMSFRTRQGKTMLAIHSLQLTQKKNSRVLKSIDGVIRFQGEGGKTVALSKKCADMKKAIPQLLGVSKAILENVIFCHQEESCWPLDTSKKLKEKFDDIFAATRYTKAMKNIREIKKTQILKLKDFNADLRVLQNDLEYCQKLEQEVDDIKIRLAQYKTRQGKAEMAIRQFKTERQPLLDKKKIFDELYNEIKSLKEVGHILRQKRQSTFDDVKNEFDETDEELRQYLVKHRETKEKKEQEMKENNRISKRNEQLLASKESEIANLNKELGGMTSRLNAHNRKVADMKKAITSTAEHYEIPGYPVNSLDDQKVKDFEKVINSVLKRQTSEFQQKKSIGQKEDDKYTKAITELEGERKQLDTQCKERQNERNRTQQKIKSLEEKLRSLEMELRSTEDIETRLQAEQGVIDKRRKSGNVSNWEERLNENQRLIESNDSALQELSKEKSNLAMQRDQLTRLKCQRKSVAQLKEKAVKLSDGVKEPVTEILGTFPEVKDIQKEVAKKIREVQAGFNKARQKLAADQQNLTTLEVKVSSKQKECALLTKRVRQCERKIRNVTEIPENSSLEELINDAKKSLNEKKDEFQLATVAEKMYVKFNKIASKRNNCPICNRAFETEQALRSFLERNTTRIDNLDKDQKVERMRLEVNTREERLSVLQSLMPAHTELKRCQEQLKGMRSDILDLRSACEAAREETDKSKIDEENFRQKSEKVRALVQKVREYVQGYKEHETAQVQLDREEERFKQLAGKEQRNLGEVEQEYNTKFKQNSVLQKQSQALSRRIRSFGQETQRLQEKVNLLQKQVMERQAKANERIKVNQEIKELTRMVDSFVTQIEGLKQAISPFEQNIRQRNQDRERARQIRVKEEAQLLRKLNETRGKIQSLGSMIKEVRAYKGGEDKLTEYKQKIEDWREELAKYRDEKKNADTQYKKALDWKESNVGTEMDMNANLNYRKACRQYDKHRKNFDVVKERLNALAEEGITTHIVNMTEELDKKIEDHQRLINEAEGAIKSETRKATEIVENLQSERYRDVDETHRRKLIEVETTKMANQDLEKYANALDRALIKFHSEKMKEINSGLKELWQTIYRGKDIDYIMIKSEEGKTTSKRKTYEYSVVLVAGDVQMDMRGRCSAGQRVLACLLVRIALAETFCSHCGILALDEPTTNLDQANVKALARALNIILSRRKDQKNFQMICITHDEEFVEELGQREHADGFYRVHKDDKQHSKVKRMLF